MAIPAGGRRPGGGWEMAARYLVLPALLVGASQVAVHGLRLQGGCRRGHRVAVPDWWMARQRWAGNWRRATWCCRRCW